MGLMAEITQWDGENRWMLCKKPLAVAVAQQRAEKHTGSVMRLCVLAGV